MPTTDWTDINDAIFELSDLEISEISEIEVAAQKVKAPNDMRITSPSAFMNEIKSPVVFVFVKDFPKYWTLGASIPLPHAC